MLRNSNEWLSMPIEAVRPYCKELRRHSPRKQNKLKKQLAHYGQVVPVIVDADHVIIDGHAIWRAMREMGAGEISVVVVANRTGAEVKALRLALNKLPQDAAWNSKMLREEFTALLDLGFDLELTAFETPEIDLMMDLDIPSAKVTEQGADIPPVQANPVSQPGDIWLCGDHRLGCGDACDKHFVEQVCTNRRASVAWIDPPFDVPIGGFVSGRGDPQHPEFLRGTGEMSSAQFVAFLAGALKVLQDGCQTRALIFAGTDWRHISELLTAGRQQLLDLYQMCVWTKTDSSVGSLYRDQHELVCVFQTAGEKPNTMQLGRQGRNRSNVWSYRGSNGLGLDRDDLLASYPTIKPVAMVADVLRDVTKRGELALDTFMGSGTTLMAAEETGRRCFGVELDPLYVDVAIRRWQGATHRQAIHAATGERFDTRATHTDGDGSHG